jgi:hypothetical protein
MSNGRDFLVFVALTLAAATPAMGQVIPDFSGEWTHPAFPWLEPPASGPGPITNLSRWPEQRLGAANHLVVLFPSKEGISNYSQLVGDYKNPILQPWAAEVVKRHRELSLTSAVPNPSNQCWPYNPPFIYKLQTIQMLQQGDTITILYRGDSVEVRRVRLNSAHPSPLKPSWYGDSVGHYEGDTLVIDTIGIKTDRKYGMIDLFGTPYTDKLHIVERYRTANWDDVKDALERHKHENWLFRGDVWTPQRDKKFLQALVTIEDEGVFTTPWTATVTYAPASDLLVEPTEIICAENRLQYHGENSTEADVPKAEKPDF